jgi:hypothetical protein
MSCSSFTRMRIGRRDGRNHYEVKGQVCLESRMSCFWGPTSPRVMWRLCGTAFAPSSRLRIAHRKHSRRDHVLSKIRAPVASDPRHWSAECGCSCPPEPRAPNRLEVLGTTKLPLGAVRAEHDRLVVVVEVAHPAGRVRRTLSSALGAGQGLLLGVGHAPRLPIHDR